ncbi:hypothetical protein [Sphingomonas sp. Leaf21]|jgi:hypothetical protein|uniref:hypothetical protein n=1 Tax=Sphingomonas sp. Leaf21 TaxID=2876550 RepID=UPI001E625DBD|nr:hypothetical protein [Sphingomonas sp. Leaf21]
MTDLFDRDLDRLASMAPPDSLQDMERRIGAVIAEGQAVRDRASFGGMVVAGGGALLLGLAGGGVMAGRMEAEAPPASLVALDAGLAPSTLLLGR